MLAMKNSKRALISRGVYKNPTKDFEDEQLLNIARQRLENPVDKENLVPFENVLEQFKISRRDIDFADEVEFE